MSQQNEIKKFLAKHQTSFVPYQYISPILKGQPFFLASQKEFTDAFLDYIGFKHITYYDNEFGEILLQFFHNYVNYYANTLPKTLNFLYSLSTEGPSFPKNCLLTKKWSRYGYLYEKFWYYQEIYLMLEYRLFSDSLIEIIQKSLNINTNDSCATVANMLDLSFENFYSHEPSGNSSLINCKHENWEYVPDNLEGFNLLITKDIPNYNGNILSKICSYQINGKYITLTASNKDDSIFAFGHLPPYATFYNFTLINKNPKYSILFFQNINQALAYEEILPKDYVQQVKSIITGHNSDKLEILDWSLLSHKKLLFICETKKKAYEELNIYKQYFEKFNISYTIFPYPLLFTKLGFDCNKKPDVSKLSHIEQELLNNALYMDKNINQNLKILWNNSLLFKDYIKWGTELGLFSKYQTEENYFQYVPLPDTDNKSFEDNIHNIQLEKLILNNSITLLHAPAETGKSLFALSIAKALLSSRQFLFFKPSQIPPKILLLDGETPPPLLQND